ncbi:MAG: hypothetical protein IAE99_13170, partial [Rhodothermales bacterium]|nr:hypothetical protein [Rhodothermales bacterium]
MQYDKSGNLLALVRNGPSGSAIDALAYSYTSGTNRLAEVTDASYQLDRGATYTAYGYDADGAVVRMDALRYSAMDFDTDLVLDRRKLPVAVSQYDMEHDVTTTVASWYSASGERYAKAVDVGGSGSSERMVLGFAGASGREAVAGVFTGTTGGTLKYWNVTSPSGEVLGRVLPG